jgi:hypothetical protein
MKGLVDSYRVKKIRLWLQVRFDIGIQNKTTEFHSAVSTVELKLLGIKDQYTQCLLLLYFTYFLLIFFFLLHFYTNFTLLTG